MGRSNGTLNRVSWDARILVDAACGTIGHVPAERSPVPRQLPRAVPGFIGRTEELAELDALSGDDATIAAVVGTAGAGKTSLVVRWAQQAQDRFPDGTLYANLRGYDPRAPARPGDVLADFLAVFGTPPDRIPAHLDARAAMFRSQLAGRRVLVVLDNASDVTQVRPFLPGGTGCAVVVTSRADLKGLEVGDGARRLPLALFSEPEAVELVRTVLGPQRADAEPEAVAALVLACARLPLALRIAAGRVATHPHLTISELVEQLDRERWQALSVPADERGAVRTVFDWSYRWLPEPQARMFRRLGLHPVAEISVHAAAGLNDVDLRTAGQLLADLAEQHLVEPAGPGRYSCHDLLRAYAADLVESDDDRDEARLRLFEWYGHNVRTAYRTVNPDDAPVHSRIELVTSGHPEVRFAGLEQAWEWADLEIGSTVAVACAAADHGLSAVALLLAEICAGALILAGHFDDAGELCHIGLAAARRLGDRRGECSILGNLAQLHSNAGRWRESRDVLGSALVMATELGDRVLEAHVLCHLGWACLHFEQFTEAKRHLEAARVLITGRKRHQPAFIEYSLSAVHAGLGDHEKALSHAERSLALLRRSDAREIESHALQAIARAKQMAGAHDEAIALCEQALKVETGREMPENRALLLVVLGESMRHAGDVERAAACWREALEAFEERGDRRAPRLKERLRELESGSSASAG